MKQRRVIQQHLLVGSSYTRSSAEYDRVRLVVGVVETYAATRNAAKEFPQKVSIQRGAWDLTDGPVCLRFLAAV